MRILFIENDPNDIELTLRAFKRDKPEFKITTAETIQLALEIIDRHPSENFDIFMTDFDLPKGDALEFLTAVHQRGLPQPIVIVTGNEDPKIRTRAYQEGVAGFIFKEKKYLEMLPGTIEKIHKGFLENQQRQSIIRVLYAEHNPVDAELTQMHFASHAAHIVLQVVSNARELEEVCRLWGKNPEYDVILLDMDIHEPSDLSILKKLKVDWEIEQPVILLTTPGDENLIVQALKLGAENSVIKNIGYFQLLPAIIEVAFTKSQLVKEQKASLERERLFRLMTENARDIVFRLRFSPDFGFDYISSAVKRLTDYAPEEFYKSPSLLMDLIDPEDFKLLQQMLAKPTHSTKPILLRWRARDGRILWVEAKGSFINDSEGNFIALEGIARDVSERIEFESVLQTENKRREELETIINKSPVIVVRWRPQMNRPLDYISENISSLGYKAKDFLDGKIFYEDIVHPEDAKKFQSEVKLHARQDDAQYRMRYRLVTKKGESRWVDDLTWVVKDDSGKSLYHQGIVTDITEQLLADEKRKQSEELYSSVVKASPDLVTIVDLQGKIVYLSPKSKDLFRLDSEEEWIGRSIYQILAPGSRDLARQNIISFLKGKPDLDAAYEAIRKDGSSLWIEIRSSLLKNTNGQPTGIISIISDVTERRKIRRALQSSEEKYRRIVDTASEGIWVTDENFIITFSNRQMAAMLGYTVDEMVGKKSDFYTFPEDKVDVLRKMQERRIGKSNQYERRYRRKDGSTLWTIVSAKPMQDEANRFLGTFAMFTDITERRQIEQTLQQAETQYHQLVEQIPAVTYIDVGDEQSTSLFTSPQVESMIGYTPKEWQEDPDLWFKIIHPDDIQKVKTEHERTNRTGEPFHLEYRLIHKDGKIVWVEDRSELLRGGAGGRDLWQGVLIDITERKNNEEKSHQSLELFELALKGADLGFWNWDIPQGRFVISPRCAEMLGYQPGEIDLTVETWDGLTHPDDLRQVYQIIDEHFRDATPSFEMETRVRAKSGEYKWLSNKGKVVERDPNGLPVRAAGTLLDITARKEAEEEQKRRILRNQDERQAIIQLALDPSVSSGDFTPALRHITETVAKVVDVERVSIWMYTEGEERIRCNELYESTPKKHSSGLVLKARDYPTYFESLRAGRSIAAYDARNDPRTLEFTDAYLLPNGISSMLDSAIRVRGKLVGVVCFEHVGEPRHWHQDEITFGGEIADQVAQVILNLERKNSEEALRSNELKFRTIIEQSAEGFVLLDESGFVIDWNRSMDRLFRVERKDVIGHYFWDVFYQVLLPEHRDQERFQSLKKSIQQALKKDDSSLFKRPIEAEIINMSGEHIFIQQTIFPIHIAGKRYLASYTQDVTDRKKAEQQVLESEARFRSLFEQASDAIFILDENKLVVCNHQTEILFGWKKDEFLGKTPPDLSPETQPDGRDSDESGLEKFELALQGKPHLFEWVHRKKNGSLFDVEVSMNRIEFGGKAMVQAIVRDITDRKKAVEVLRVSEEKYRGLFENSIIGISQTLPDGKLISANKAFVQMYGYKNLSEMMKEVSHVGQLYADQREREEVLRILREKGEMRSREMAMKRRDGSQFYILLGVREIRDAQNNLVFYQSEHVDITERKLAETGLQETEKRYRGLFEDSPISLWEEDFSGVKQYLDSLKKRGVKDFHRYLRTHPEAILECLNRVRIIDVNQATLKLYGAAHKDDLLKNLDQVMTEESNKWFIKEIEEIADGKIDFRWEGLNRTLAGKDILIELHWSAVPGCEETLSRVIISIEDITERKQIEAALHESESRYRGLFEDSPISLWEEDFSEVKKYLNSIKKRGVKNFRHYFHEHPEVVFECAQRVRILDVNRATVKLYGATSKKEDLMGKLSLVFCEESIPGVANEIISIAEDRLDFEEETINRTIAGQKIDINLHWTVAPGYEDSLSRVIISITDITERKKAEEQLHQSEEKYRELFERMQSGVAVYQAVDEGNDFEILDLNRQAEKIEGVKRKAVLGKRVTQAFPGAVQFGILEIFKRVWQTGKAEFFPAALYKDEKGRETWRENWIYRLPDGKIVAIYSDVSQRKQSEDAIRISEARYRSLVENQTAIISRTDLDGNLTFVNDKFCQSIGRKRKELLGNRIQTTVLPEDQHLVEQAIEEAMKPPYHSQLENRNITAQGIRWFRWENSAILDSQGNIDEMQYVGWDITEQRKAREDLRISEERYRLMADNMSDTIWLMDLNFNFTYISPSVTKTRGFTLEELQTLPLEKQMTPASLEKMMEQIAVQGTPERLAQKDLEISYSGELEVYRKDGSTFWAEVTTTLIRAEDGSPLILLGTGRDITERKNAQSDLQRRDEILEAVSFTATRLLEAAEWKKQAPIILEKLGRAARVDRVFLLEYPSTHGVLDFSKIIDNLIEWSAPGVKHLLQDSLLANLVDFPKVIDRWQKTLTRGEMIVATPGSLLHSEKAFFEMLGPRGIVIGPILVDGSLWGLLGFDQVTADHAWDSTELEALKTFADTFASAIQRHKAYADLLDRETRLHAILEASKDAIRVSLNDMTVYANTAYLKLFGLSEPDDLEDHDISSLIAPVDRQRYHEISQARQEGKTAPTHYEVKALKKNGSEFDLEVHVSTYELLRETYTLAILRDITEKKQHDRELEALSTVSTALRKARSLEEMYPIIVDQLVKVMHAEGGTVSLEEPTTGEMVIQYGGGEFTGHEGFHIPAGKGLRGEVKISQKPYISHDLKIEPKFQLRGELENCKEAVIYPMISQKHVIGTLLVSRQQPFDKSEIRVIGSIAEMAANAIQRSALHEQTEARLQKLIALRQIETAISSTLDLQQIMDIILTSSQKFLNVDAADILLYDEGTRRLKYAYGVGFRTQMMSGFSVSIGEGWAGQAARTGKPVFIPDLKRASDKIIKPALKVEELVSYYAVPLITNNQVKGVMECLTRSPLHQDQDWVEFVNLLAGQAAIAINSAQLFEDIKLSNIQLVRAYDETIEGWSRAMDIRDKETEGHTHRVVDLTLRLARAMGVAETKLTHMKRGALLHDIGKLVVPDTILFKPSELTDLEWTIMRKHPQSAYNMLASIEYLKPALDIPYRHHEHWDGSGYPHGLKGEEIPLAARIFAVVDIWDALLSDRPYRSAWTREQTVAYIKDQSGKLLDPKVVTAFLKIISEIYH